MIRHLFIINPKAGIRNVVEEATERIRRAFILNTDRENEKYDIVLTKNKGDATELARLACKENPGFTKIYACGGDGTLHEVVNGVVGAENVSVCPVPVGSGNDFIRCFDQIPREKFLDISACIRGEDFACDVLRCGDFYSLNNISAGLDAATGKRQGKVKKLPFVSGGAAYKLALAYSFMTSMKNPIRFEIDGEPVTVGKGDVTLAVLGNGKWYGGGFQATPLADLQDGLMDLCTVPTISRLEFLKYVGDYKRGDHLKTMPTVFYKKCKKIRLLSPEPICLQADGEIFIRRDPEIEVVPGAIRMILPDGACAPVPETALCGAKK